MAMPATAVSSQTDNLATVTVGDGAHCVVTAATWIWQTVGMELAIFVVTVAFSFLIRRGRIAANKRIFGNVKFAAKDIPQVAPPPQRQQYQQKQHHLAHSTPAATSPGGFQKRSADWGDLQRVVQGFAQTGEDVLPEAPVNLPARRQRPREDLWHIVADIMDGARNQPGNKFCERALDLYGELRRALREDPELRMSDLAKRARHSALDLYTVVVQCAVRARQIHLVDGIISDMMQQRVTRPLVFYEGTMKQLAGQKQYHLALGIYDRLSADGLVPSAVTLSCLINFAAEVGELERAVGFFGKLCTLTCPSIRACMTVLRVHAKRQDWLSAVATFNVMREAGVEVDTLALNVVLATGVAADRMEAVEQLLAGFEAASSRCVSDVVSYNTLVKGYAHRGDAVGARRVLERIGQRGLRPNAITFNTFMDAAVRSGRPDQAWQALSEMRAAGLSPDKFTCSILVKGLSIAKKTGIAPNTAMHSPSLVHVRDALELLRDGPRLDATLGTALHHAVLEAAAQVPDATLVMEAFSQMRKNGVVPSDAALRRVCELVRSSGLPPALVTANAGFGGQSECGAVESTLCG